MISISASWIRRWVVTSAMPMPLALWWVSSVSPRTTIRWAVKPSLPALSAQAKRPVTLGSMPSPLQSLPILSTISVSACSKRMLPILLFASSRSAGSCSQTSSAVIPTILQVSSYAFSIRPRPAMILLLSKTTRPTFGMMRPILMKPDSWTVSAPCCLPMPITDIFTTPLS